MMMRKALPIAPILLLASSGSGSASRVSSKLQVHLPQSLSKTDGYDHREALFGVPPYGGSIQQSVYYAASDLCDQNVNRRGGYPARENDSTGQPAPWKSPFILMVDRGDCTFVTKVRNAQRSGAAGVIIADNTCLCSAGPSCEADPGTECETREPIMADDGSGSDITIPSFLMFKQDADPIKEVLISNQMVRMEMAWALPNPDARVEYDLWTTPTDVVSREFQEQFKVAAKALGDAAYFTPHMYIYDGMQSGCQNDNDQNQCYNLCTNNGRYCATDPDGDLDKGISGADVVRESLRRICIWKIYGKDDGIGEKWWDYVGEFTFRCAKKPKLFVSGDCVDDAMEKAGVGKALVESCIANSGGVGVNDDNPNELLQTELAAKEAAGVVILPAAFVNSAAIRGALEFAVIFKAICAGYEKGSEPQICFKCANCQDEHKCVIKGSCGVAQGSVSIPVFAGALLAVVLFFGIVGLVQWQRSQRHMREQVKGILAEYMPLDENSKAETAGIPEEEGEFA